VTFPTPGVYREDQLIRRVTLTVDVPQMIRELEGVGLSDVDIKLRCGVQSASAVSAWRAGDKLPSFIPGLRLLLLHLEVCPATSPLRTVVALQPSCSRCGSSIELRAPANRTKDEGAEHGQAEEHAHAEPDRSVAGSQSR
jgi:hypothetical protein